MSGPVSALEIHAQTERVFLGFLLGTDRGGDPCVTRKTVPKKTTAALFAKLDRLAKILGGIPVWEVYADSGAAAAGVRFGDIILRVNGKETPTFEQFLEVGEAHMANLEFEVFRNGKTLRLSCEALG
jgi:S1-C subfamily serine protease